MVAIVQAMSPQEKLALIQAHPDLGSRVAMAEASVAEQSGVGLDQLSAAEYEQFQQLNQQYRQTFGFPFISGRCRPHERVNLAKLCPAGQQCPQRRNGPCPGRD